MSEHVRYFQQPAGTTALVSSIDPAALISEWAGVRSAMIRGMAELFTRNEWAHLIQALDEKNLWAPFRESFGEPLAQPAGAVNRLVRPREAIAVWLSSNVNLLGPLVLLYLSLTGATLRMKAGSKGPNLVSSFIQFLRPHLIKGGALHRYLDRNVVVEAFDRTDSRNADMARESDVRIVFGTDGACREIDRLEHPLDSAGFYFHDRRSEAWIQPSAVTEAHLIDLIKVFAVYGQSACTAPRRVVLLNGDARAAEALQQRLVSLWGRVVSGTPEPAAASSNLMATQWAAADGWRAIRTPDGSAVIVSGPPDREALSSNGVLTVVAASDAEAVASLTPEIQTVGHLMERPLSEDQLRRLATTRIKRFVPLSDMHAFGPSWDGWAYWANCFEVVPVRG